MRLRPLGRRSGDIEVKHSAFARRERDEKGLATTIYY
jgi:hypothetical protein